MKNIKSENTTTTYRISWTKEKKDHSLDLRFSKSNVDQEWQVCRDDLFTWPGESLLTEVCNILKELNKK